MAHTCPEMILTMRSPPMTKFEVLSDEKIGKIIQESLGEEAADLKEYEWLVTPQDTALCQAQLSQDQQAHQEIVREILGRINFVFVNNEGMSEEEWQAVREIITEKYLGGQA